MTDFDPEIPTGFQLVDKTKDRLHHILIFAGGVIVGLSATVFAIGTDVSEMRGQLGELVKIAQQVKVNKARIDEIDYVVQRRTEWRPMK